MVAIKAARDVCSRLIKSGGEATQELAAVLLDCVTDMANKTPVYLALIGK
jgi:hypothetical protein